MWIIQLSLVSSKQTQPGSRCPSLFTSCPRHKPLQKTLTMQSPRARSEAAMKSDCDWPPSTPPIRHSTIKQEYQLTPYEGWGGTVLLQQHRKLGPDCGSDAGRGCADCKLCLSSETHSQHRAVSWRTTWQEQIEVKERCSVKAWTSTDSQTSNCYVTSFCVLWFLWGWRQKHDDLLNMLSSQTEQNTHNN